MKKIENRPIKYILLGMLSILYLIVFFCISFPVYGLENKVNEYTNVLSDLQSDKEFNVDEYPNDPYDYSIKLVQIAESELKGLMLYVYNPCYQTKKYEATYVNLSKNVEGTSPSLYSLKLLSNEGAICKYLVENFKVSNFTYRYYNITSIYRPYDSEIDETYDPSVNNLGSIKHTGFEVGQLWCVYYLNDNLKYEMVRKDTVSIDIKIYSYLRYNNGFELMPTSCDSFFVAFSCDEYTIEHIYDADMVYSSHLVHERHQTGIDTKYTYEDEVLNASVYLSDKDTVTHTGNGLFARTYSWNRIQSTSEFMSTNDNILTSSQKSDLSNTQWVFNYLESEYSTTVSQSSYTYHYTETFDITILRLHFLSKGKVYNFGVISNIGDSTDDPFNTPGLDLDLSIISDWFEKIMQVVGIIILVVLLVAFAPLIANILNIIFTLLKWAFKLIITIISAPFKLFSRKKHKY